MGRRMHLVISIRWLERHLSEFKTKDKRKLYCYEVHGMPEEEVMKEIERYKEIWYSVIPHEDCDNISPDWHCLGHETPDFITPNE